MMYKRKTWALCAGAFCLALLCLGASATEIPIDSTNFDANPSDKVTFHPDGSATIMEDPFLGTTLLTNAPPVNPEVIIALPNTILSFNYDLTFGAFDTGDVFSAVLLESGVATPFELIVSMPGSGLLEFDLEALGLTGVSELGIEFALESNFDFESGSTIFVSNLQTRQVPLPGSLLLMSAGLVAWRISRRQPAIPDH